MFSILFFLIKAYIAYVLICYFFVYVFFFYCFITDKIDDFKYFIKSSLKSFLLNMRKSS